MRLLHTADWHLGRTLGGASLLPDQHALLHGAFLDAVRDHRPDAVLVAGDVFDRAVPPTDAVRLLDSVLEAVVLGLGVPVVLIAGNHDAPERLRFGQALLRARGLHIGAEPVGAPVRLEDAHGPVWIATSAYAAPGLLAEACPEAAVACHDTGMAAVCDRLRALVPPGERRVLVAHAFVRGAWPGDVERPLALGAAPDAGAREDAREDAGENAGAAGAGGFALGGAGTVALARLDGFDYVALGHLHRPQDLGGGRARYAGSPLALSFAEARHPRSLTLVELDVRGAVRTEALPLPAPRRLRTLTGRLDALLADPGAADRGDWLSVRLTDADAPSEPMARLRRRWPHVLELHLAERAPGGVRPGGGAWTGAGGTADGTADPLAVLAAFHAEALGRPIEPAAREAARPLALDALAALAGAEGG